LLIVFDLDGTLIDSVEDLTISVNAMLEHLGKRRLDAERIQNYVGNGAPALVRRAIGEDESDEAFDRALAFFTKYYRQHSLQHTTLYAGIKELLIDLRGMGHQLAVLTNKPVKISTDILAGLNVRQHFFRIYGGDSFPAKKPDPAGLRALIQESGLSDGSVLMVGDSPVDIHTARNARVRCCGVLWGFQPHMLQTSSPDMLIGEPHQLLAYL
jgi:phosphoglycolate phosphatase